MLVRLFQATLDGTIYLDDEFIDKTCASISCALMMISEKRWCRGFDRDLSANWNGKWISQERGWVFWTLLNRVSFMFWLDGKASDTLIRTGSEA